mmetsp:Transcript_6475/g.826  ORF Transcript_6475/g.826 Transcript_6475/m.826 type:complete len:158 (+) Transcript_6475:109-582(+)
MTQIPHLLIQPAVLVILIAVTAVNLIYALHARLLTHHQILLLDVSVMTLTTTLLLILIQSLALIVTHIARLALDLLYAILVKVVMPLRMALLDVTVINTSMMQMLRQNKIANLVTTTVIRAPTVLPVIHVNFLILSLIQLAVGVLISTMTQMQTLQL